MVFTPNAAKRLTARRSKETNTSAPKRAPENANIPSAKSPPAASKASPASAAGRFITILRVLMSVWMVAAIAASSKL